MVTISTVVNEPYCGECYSAVAISSSAFTLGSEGDLCIFEVKVEFVLPALAVSFARSLSADAALRCTGWTAHGN
jgi:hypothetical protein